MITLEDVWCIIRILIHGQWVVYDIDGGNITLNRVFMTDDLRIEDYEINLRYMETHFDTFPMLLVKIISVVLVPNKRS